MKRYLRISRIALAAGAIVALAGPSGATASGKRAVVEVRTVKVGAPGNPSVGIVPFTDAVYQSCAGAPPSQVPTGRRRRLPLRHRSARDHRRAVGEVPQHRRSDRPRPAQSLRLDRELLGVAEVRPDQRVVARPRGAATTRWPFRSGRTSRTASPTSCGRRASSTRSTTGGLLSKQASGAGGFKYVTYQVRLSRADRARDVRPGPQQAQRRDPSPQVGLRRPEPGRVDQGGLLRPERRRHLLLLEVPDQPGRLRRRRPRPLPSTTDARPDDRRCHERGDAAAGDLPRLGPAGAELVPGGRAAQQPARASTRSGSTRPPTPRSTRAASARSARR